MSGAAVVRVTLGALLVAMLEGLSAPHLHDPWEPGVYNQEHDFRLARAANLTALSMGAVLVLLSAKSVLTEALTADGIPPSAPSRRTSSRGPPSRQPSGR